MSKRTRKRATECEMLPNYGHSECGAPYGNRDAQLISTMWHSSEKSIPIRVEPCVT